MMQVALKGHLENTSQQVKLQIPPAKTHRHTLYKNKLREYVTVDSGCYLEKSSDYDHWMSHWFLLNHAQTVSLDDHHDGSFHLRCGVI